VRIREHCPVGPVVRVAGWALSRSCPFRVRLMLPITTPCSTATASWHSTARLDCGPHPQMEALPSRRPYPRW